jgi:hypothetical protein
LLYAAAAALCVCGSVVAARPAFGGSQDDAKVILFSGTDLWRNGAFLYGGLLAAPGGLNRDGFFLKLLFSVGSYRYTAGNLGGTEVTGGQVIGAVLPGWRIKRGNLEAKFFVGPDVEYHPLWPDDPGNRLRGTATGLRMATEFWYEPTAATMVAASGSFVTIAGNNSARLAAGWHVLDGFMGGFYVGPEAQYFSCDGYRHWRFGGHVTGLKTGRSEWSAAAGWARDSDDRGGLYLRLDFLTRR